MSNSDKSQHKKTNSHLHYEIFVTMCWDVITLAFILGT